MDDFFRHESAPYPPALSSGGCLNACTESDLLLYIREANASSTLSDDE